MASALPKHSSPSSSMKFPDEVPIWPTQGTEWAFLQELLMWHAEVAASCYAYQDRLTIQDAFLVRGRIVAKEVRVVDNCCQYAWDCYCRLVGLSALGEPLMPLSRSSSRMKGKGKGHALTVSLSDKKEDEKTDEENVEESPWTGIEGRDNDGGSDTGASPIMDVS